MTAAANTQGLIASHIHTADGAVFHVLVFEAEDVQGHVERVAGRCPLSHYVAIQTTDPTHSVPRAALPQHCAPG